MQQGMTSKFCVCNIFVGHRRVAGLKHSLLPLWRVRERWKHCSTFQNDPSGNAAGLEALFFTRNLLGDNCGRWSVEFTYRRAPGDLGGPWYEYIPDLCPVF